MIIAEIYVDEDVVVKSFDSIDELSAYLDNADIDASCSIVADNFVNEDLYIHSQYDMDDELPF